LNTESQTVRAVERAIDVLDAIRVQGESAGVSEISERLGLPKSTVHRLLIALLKKNMVRQTSTERYALGYKAFEIALSAARQMDLVVIAAPYLEELREQLGETAALALKVGLRYTYVSQAVSAREHRVSPVLGHQYPLHWGATGKIILAFAEQDELDECLKTVPSLRATPRTVIDPHLLLEQLEQIRAVGYAVSFGERSMGAAAIAAPVLNRRGTALASLCVIGPESRIRETDLEALGRAVAETTRRLQNLCQLLGLGD
jgi:IclR family transcriptional regulator, KDG regulon repressor